jgi:outer membrane protein W
MNGTGQAQSVSVQTGIYNFTEDLANEFYTLAPGIFAGVDVVSWERLKLNTGAGFAFTPVKYNNHKHLLYFLPVFISLKYDLVNEGSKIKPFVAAGISLAGKADKNRYFDKTHYAFTYGYHIQGGISRRISNILSLQFDMRYNLLITPVMEEINISGVTTTIGFLLNL